MPEPTLEANLDLILRTADDVPVRLGDLATRPLVLIFLRHLA